MGIPNIAIIIPGQVYCGLNHINNEQNAIPITIYMIGSTGNPKALYGLSANGCFLRRRNIPIIVNT